MFSPKATTNRLRLVCAVAGLLTLGVGAFRGLEPANAQVVTVLVGAGVLLMLVPLLIERLKNVKGLGIELDLAESVRDMGATSTADILGRSDLAQFAESYSLVHSELEQFEDAKIHLQDVLIGKAAALARLAKFDSGEVEHLLREGSPVHRVLAVGLMIGDQGLATDRAILESVMRSRSGNEQFHAMKLASDLWGRLSTRTRKRLLGYMLVDRNIQQDEDRRRLAAKMRSLADE